MNVSQSGVGYFGITTRGTTYYGDFRMDTARFALVNILHKSLWIRSIWIVLTPFLMAFAFVPAAVAGSEGNQKQEALIQSALDNFYREYLHYLANNREPSDEFLAKNVSLKLIKKIQKLASIEGGLGADYFLQAQDYLDDWNDNIDVAQIRVVRNRAEAVVSFGVPGAEHQIFVNLVLNNHRWKISEVRARKR